MDGQLVQILNTTASQTTYQLISGLEYATHQILITKRTEALFGVASFGGFQVSNGELLFSSKQMQQQERAIEFVRGFNHSVGKFVWKTIQEITI